MLHPFRDCHKLFVPKRRKKFPANVFIETQHFVASYKPARLVNKHFVAKIVQHYFAIGMKRPKLVLCAFGSAHKF